MPSLRSPLFLVSALLPFLSDPAAGQCALRPGLGTTGGEFGSSLSIHGDTLVVGAPRADGSGPSSGAAWVFEFGGGGWVEAQKLSPPAVGTFHFGADVAVVGDTILVGATFADGLEPQSGAVYLFERSGAIWALAQVLVAADGRTSDQFGGAVALDPDGERALVGAWAHNHAGTSSGAAYLFERGAGGWTQVQKLAATDLYFDFQFGTSVALIDDRALVGAPGAYGPCAPGCRPGAAYVFEPEPNGTWTQRAKLLSEVPTESQAHGFAVALRGEHVVVGDLHYEDRGAAFLYEEQDGAWPLVKTLRRPELPTDAWLGFSVAMDGDEVVVGAPMASRAFVWTRRAGDWVASATLDNPQIHGDFGSSVEMLGRSVLVGAPDTFSALGAAFRFVLDPDLRPDCICDHGAPCANGTLCAGCRNSSGTGSLLVGEGSTSVAADELVLTASGVPPNRVGMLFMGTNAPQLAFGDGRLCVGGAIGRFVPKSSGPEGRLTEGPGIVAWSQGLAPSLRIAAGSTRVFQAWFRDRTGPCGSGFNLSSSLRATFRP